MANTEKLVAIGLVADALGAVVQAQSGEVSAADLKRLQLEELRLNALHRGLVQSATARRVKDLKKVSGQLRTLNGKLDKKVARLKSVAQKVDRAARAVDIVAKILEQTLKLAAV